MAAPGILTGSHLPEEIFREGSPARSNSGVFGRNPGATPKYAFNAGRRGRSRDAENKESMARLFVEIPESERETFLATVSAETRPLARVLMSGVGGGNGFIDFLLTQTSENFEEKAQIVDTLTDNFVAFYSGQAPPMVQCSGILLNTFQDDQRVWMMRLYQEILRGSRLATRGLIARLRYDSFLLSGYLSNLSLGLTGDSENGSNFSFNFLVKRMSIFTPMLGLPTTVSTPAIPGLVADEERRANTSSRTRVAAVMPEFAPEMSSTPAATPTVLTTAQQEQIRTDLRAQSFTDAQIDESLSRSQSTTTQAGEADAREAQLAIQAQGLNRMTEQSVGPDANIDNVSSDGVSGFTNIRTTDTIPELLRASTVPAIGPLSLPDGTVNSSLIESPLDRWVGSRR